MKSPLEKTSTDTTKYHYYDNEKGIRFQKKTNIVITISPKLMLGEEKMGYF